MFIEVLEVEGKHKQDVFFISSSEQWLNEF
jgi:hypothetical protein